MPTSAANGDDAEMVVTAKRFPWRRLGWRMRYSAESAQGRLPMMLWGPMIGAVIGTLVALHDHPEVIRHGLVVSLPSSGEVVAGAATGAVVGVGVTFLLAFLWASVRYLARGDDTWEVVYCGRHAKTMFFALRCRASVAPADPQHLGHVECWSKNLPGRCSSIAGFSFLENCIC